MAGWKFIMLGLMRFSFGSVLNQISNNQIKFWYGWSKNQNRTEINRVKKKQTHDQIIKIGFGKSVQIEYGWFFFLSSLPVTLGREFFR